ncbi:hypothetical protein GBAR_LOCUS28314 [Geodia barretti]|uniref:Uncharacterized protein n=1 Tax=Geodia barretti TaxID=519541 RepID=A0AA35XAP4_GEOBA|nr:hypothetical protein GBAR_LOCUS28314 [Geodia barretti]
MQRGLPVRKVSIPYHGMTIPIPCNNSFYSPPSSNQTAQNMAESSTSQLQNTTSTDTKAKVGKNSPAPISSGTHSQSPPKSAWVHTGRGRALQKLVSHGVVGVVGRRQSATQNSDRSGGIASPPPLAVDLSEADPAIAAGPEDDEPALDAGNADNNELDSGATGNAVNYDLDSGAHASDLDHDERETIVPAGSAGPEGEPTVSTQTTDIADNHNSGASAKLSPSENIAVVNAPAVETEAKSPPPAKSQSLQSPSCAGQPFLSPVSSAKTPTSSRKSRISLAIQFKGVCSSSPSAQEFAATTTPQKVSEDREYTLMRPSHFMQQSITPPSSGKTLTGDADAIIKDAGVAAELMKRKETQHELRCSASQEILTQDYFEDCGPLCLSPTMPPLLINTDYSNEDSEGQREEREDFLDSVSSDDGGEGEREGARMGLSAAQLEETISLHQRNTHRNRVEAKRIERRVKGTEEVLAADVAEQCAQEDEDSLNYNITESREKEMARVLDLQLQFDSQSIEETRYEYFFTSAKEAIPIF